MSNKYRKNLYLFVSRPYIDNFIMACIVLNVFTMSLYGDKMSKSLENFIETTNLIFLIIYTVEFVIKIIGLGPQLYFYSD
jgi:voltage-gated sodium channel type III alpha